MLFDPEAHETPTDTPWDESAVRAAIAEIVADAEAAFDDAALWPIHDLDVEAPDERERPWSGVYLGAAGTIWALADLARRGFADGRDWSPVAATLHERYLAAPDGGERAPGLLLGESGVLLVADGLAPDDARRARMLECVRENTENPALELLWGAPGTMRVAHAMHARTGDDAWADAWRDSADAVWRAWDGDVWLQDLYGREVRYVGSGHGFAGNVAALVQGSRLDDARRAELETRVVDVATRLAQRDGGLAQWPAVLGGPSPMRTQWCHGAPGMVVSLAPVAPADEDFGALLSAGGELTWHAGPLTKGAGLCHGTAGNGYAFLTLLTRTGDELWLRRARVFAMHAIEQLRAARAEHGRGRHALWTGDPGTALYLADCVDGGGAFPTLDRW